MRTGRARREIGAIALVAAALWLAASGDVASGAPAASAGSASQPLGFLTGPDSRDPLDIALAYLVEHAGAYGMAGADVDALVLTDRFTSAHSGTTHLHFQQRHDDLDVRGGTVHVNVAADGRIANVGNRSLPMAGAPRGRRAPGLGADAAVRAAAAHLGLAASGPLLVRRAAGAPASSVTVSGGGVSRGDIPARLVWELAGDGALRLAWRLEIHETSRDHYWGLSVDAATGDVLWQDDAVVRERRSRRPGRQQAARRRAAPVAVSPLSDGPAAALLAAAPGGDGARVAAAPRSGAAYRVFAHPVESPQHGARTLALAPASPTASPFGWHDADGVAGPEFTDTRGNNVFAQEDIDANNSGGTRPEGGAALQFDFAYDAAGDLGANLPAAITNLFYWNNVLHDVLYGYGFDEAAGNFQFDNYGAPGAPGDPVQADALDGSDVDNANFLTLPDGSPPRMQMFRWVFPLPNAVTVNAPGVIAGDYSASAAEFGPAPSSVGVTADVVLVDDATGVASDGCEVLQNAPAIAGRIALVERGTCLFVDKVRRAQAAGAVAVIVINSQPGAPIAMGGSDPTLVIPAVMLSDVDGAAIVAELPGVSATVRSVDTSSIPDRDSDFDGGVISHEYAHGVSNRLTGGPAATFCLGNEEQMGEGWSDLYGLVMTAEPGHGPETLRGLATWLSFEPVDGNGLRPAPYTTDLAANPYTYADRADDEISIPHGVGFLWASMLWEVYWNLVADHGFNPVLSDDWTTGGNNLAIQLVTDGLKLQPCGPGFVDGRSAILLADQMLTGGANQCSIWRGFAKRGLGMSASQGSASDRTDGAAAFDVPAPCAVASLACEVETTQASYGPGEVVTLSTLRFANAAAEVVPARLRLELEVPGVGSVAAIDAVLELPPGLDADLAPTPLFAVTSQPTGDWTVRCSLDEPVTGARLAEDSAPFALP